MKQQFIVLPRFFLSLFLTLVCSIPAFSEPSNFGALRNEIKTYHDSGAYDQDLEQKIKEAQHYISRQAAINKTQKHPEKLALVLDIDETSLSNYNSMVKRDFYGNSKQINADIMAANAPAIKPMLVLYKQALKKGIRVFFVTGRKESERQATRNNLLKAGYSNWAGLYLRPENYAQSSIIPFKSQTRALITKKGYTIIASIGDQFSDIRGGYNKKGFKLPNPFYYLP